MPFGNRCGSGALRHFETAIRMLGVMYAESRGERTDFHVTAQGGGCLEITLKNVSQEHVCEVPLRTFGSPEEALVLYRCLIEKLPLETQMHLYDYLGSQLEGQLKRRAV